MASQSSKIAARKSRIRTVDCHGKSKFFLEHQAMWEKEGKNKGYDPSIHSSRFAYQLPLPEGKWPSKFPRRPLDEHDKEVAARRGREEKRLNQEAERKEEQRRRRIEEQLRRRREQFASGKVPWRHKTLRKDALSRDEMRHVSNVQMAVDFVNGKCPEKKYELCEITAKHDIIDFGSVHCHYNFIAYSPTHGFEFFFAEVDTSFESKRRVLQCCTVWTGPHGYCWDCQNHGDFLIHPSSDKFFAGDQEDICWL